MAILVIYLLTIIHRYIMLAILISNEYLGSIILLNPLGCVVLLPVTFVQMRAEKFSTLLLIRFQGKLFLKKVVMPYCPVQSISKQFI